MTLQDTPAFITLYFLLKKKLSDLYATTELNIVLVSLQSYAALIHIELI